MNQGEAGLMNVKSLTEALGAVLEVCTQPMLYMYASSHECTPG